MSGAADNNIYIELEDVLVHQMLRWEKTDNTHQQRCTHWQMIAAQAYF